MLVVGVATAGLFVLPDPACSQQDTHLQIIVATTTGEVPVGAIYVIADSMGRDLRRGLVPDDGIVRAHVPTPARYTVSLQRMGIADWTSEPMVVTTEPRSVAIRVPIDAVAVGELRARGEQVCPGSPAQAKRAVDLYLDLLEKLDEVVATEQEKELAFALRLAHERGDRRILENRGRGSTRWVDTTVAVVPIPLATLEPKELAHEGYPRLVPGDTFPRYFAPTAAVLLSQPFLATHCLSYTETGAEADSVGLAFEPRPARDVLDVEGVLWVSRHHHELRSLAYRYAGLQRFLTRVELPRLVQVQRDRIDNPGVRVSAGHPDMREGEYRYGGIVRFTRLANGLSIVRSWEIWTPMLWFSAIGTAGRYDMRPVAYSLTTTAEVLALVPIRSDEPDPPGHPQR